MTNGVPMTDYMSVTTWNNSHFPKFDNNVVITKMMGIWKFKNTESKKKYAGMSRKEIIAQWDKIKIEASEAGTKLHYAIECFYKDDPIDEETKNSIGYGYFEDFLKENPNLKPHISEWRVFDEELKIAGTMDITYKNEDGSMQIYDWKRSKLIKKENKYQSGETPCISHLPDSNFWHYALQLNTYKYIIEKNYNTKINGMFIVCMHPDNENGSFLRFEIPDLSNEINALMKMKKPSGVTK